MSAAISDCDFPRNARLASQRWPGQRHDCITRARKIHQFEDVVGDVTADVARRVSVSEHRVELDGIQVDDLARMAGISQPVGEPFEHAVVERVWVVVRVDRQDFHGDSRS